MPAPLRKLGFVVGVLFLVLFATYQHDFRKEGGETREEWKLGVWFSPWVTFLDVERHDDTPAQSGRQESSSDFSWSYHMTFLSWSWPALIAGLVLVGLCSKPREKTA